MANNHLHTGNIRQIPVNDKGYNLAGDICLIEDWNTAKKTGEFAWLDGRTNGQSFELDVNIAGETVGRYT